MAGPGPARPCPAARGAFRPNSGCSAGADVECRPSCGSSVPCTPTIPQNVSSHPVLNAQWNADTSGGAHIKWRATPAYFRCYVAGRSDSRTWWVHCEQRAARCELGVPLLAELGHVHHLHGIVSGDLKGRLRANRASLYIWVNG